MEQQQQPSQKDIEKSHKEYLAKRINPIMEKLILAILTEKPDTNEGVVYIHNIIYNYYQFNLVVSFNNQILYENTK